MTWLLKDNWCSKRGVGESTLKQIYAFGKNNKLCLEDRLLKC